MAARTLLRHQPLQAMLGVSLAMVASCARQQGAETLPASASPSRGESDVGEAPPSKAPPSKAPPTKAPPTKAPPSPKATPPAPASTSQSATCTNQRARLPKSLLAASASPSLARDVARRAAVAALTMRTASLYPFAEELARQGVRDAASLVANRRCTQPWTAIISAMVGDRASVRSLEEHFAKSLAKSGSSHRDRAAVELAQAHEWLGDTQTADRRMRGVFRPEAWIDLAEIAVETKRPKRAAALLGRLGKRARSNLMIRAAKLYVRLKMRGKALATLEAAKDRLDPGRGQDMVALGRIARMLGELGKRRWAFAAARRSETRGKALASIPEEDWYLDLHAAYRAAGKTKAVRELWKRYERFVRDEYGKLGWGPNDPIAWAFIARARARRGDARGARAAIARAGKRSTMAPTKERIPDLLAQAHLALGDVPAALREAARTRAAQPRLLLEIARYCRARHVKSTRAIQQALQQFPKKAPRRMTKAPRLVKGNTTLSLTRPGETAARKKRITAELTIDATGKVASVKLTAPLGPGLDRRVIETIKRFVFTPAELDGEPGPITLRMEIAVALPPPAAGGPPPAP